MTNTPTDNFIRNICRVAFLLTLGGWIGGMVFFAAVTAPAAFAATARLADSGSQVAGSVVRIALGVLNVTAFGLTPLCMALMFAGESEKRRFTRTVGILMVAFVAIGLLSLVSHGVVTTRLDELRAMMGVIDTVPVSDPRRMEFNRLHKVSVGLLVFQLVTALGVFGTVGWRWLGEPRRRRSKEHARS